MNTLENDSLLILPGDIRYKETLSQVPFWWKNFAAQNDECCNFGVDVETGLLKPLNRQQTWEYLFEGELEERLEQAELEPEDVWCDYTQEELKGVEQFFIDL
jgi:hypothetical protein